MDHDITSSEKQTTAAQHHDDDAFSAGADPNVAPDLVGPVNADVVDADAAREEAIDQGDCAVQEIPAGEDGISVVPLVGSLAADSNAAGDSAAPTDAVPIISTSQIEEEIDEHRRRQKAVKSPVGSGIAEMPTKRLAKPLRDNPEDDLFEAVRRLWTYVEADSETDPAEGTAAALFDQPPPIEEYQEHEEHQHGLQRLEEAGVP
ncbi:hypothetical protein N9L19_00015 [bacterium]|nr:hypothetical protein [bacterium]